MVLDSNSSIVLISEMYGDNDYQLWFLRSGWMSNIRRNLSEMDETPERKGKPSHQHHFDTERIFVSNCEGMRLRVMRSSITENKQLNFPLTWHLSIYNNRRMCGDCHNHHPCSMWKEF
jgi:hypothetical protein